VTAYALPVLATLLVWWFSTGLILFLDGLPRRTFPWSMAAATAIGCAALYGLAETSGDATVADAYVAFTCGILVWGWHELAFLTGLVTGPRRTPCPPGAAGWRRFGYAVETLLFHELAILATAVLVVALTRDGINQVGTWTFLLLWLMRLSAKLNLFLGVPNLAAEFLPDHLRYLRSYQTRKGMNFLFPGSITISVVTLTVLVQRAAAPEAGPFEVVGFTLLSTMTALAILEHWFLVLPFPVAALWRWGFRSRDPGPAKPCPPLEPALVLESLGPNQAPLRRRRT
jgi:putative photosynthetic complex assembly protein 2